MSLQLSTRVNGTPVLNFGSGAIPAGARVVAGCRLTEDAQIYAAVSGTVATYCQGLPFDSDGRLLAAFNSVATYSNGIPLDSSGFLCAGGVVPATWSGGLPFDSDGALAGWSPLYLFSSGANGFVNQLALGTLYTDTAGTTPVTTIGDTIALGIDQSGNSNDMVHATAAARPVYGRMPVSGVRNLFPARSDDRAVTNGAQFGAGSAFQINTYDGYDSLVAVDGGLTGRLYAVGAVGVWYAIRFQARRLAGTGWFRDPGASASALRQSDYLVYSVGVGSDDWVDCVLIGTPPDGTRINYRLAWDSEIGLEIALRNIQVELVEPNTTEPTAYQSVGAGPYDITQSGVPDTPIAYMDTSDDNFSWTLPAGTYHLFIAGELGCYFDTVEHAGGEFTVGPTSWTGGPTGAITTLIGQRHVIMPVIRDEAFTQSEKELMVAYVMAKGAPGVWEREQLVANGDFAADADWIKGDTGVIENGYLEQTAPTTSYASQQIAGAVAGLYEYDLTILSGSFFTGFWRLSPINAQIQSLATLNVGRRRGFVTNPFNEMAISFVANGSNPNRMGSVAVSRITLNTDPLA